MDDLDKWFYRKIKESIKPDVIFFNLTVKQFAEWGVMLSDAQKSNIKVQLQKESIENFSIDVTDAQEEQIRNAGYDPKKLSLDFNNFDIAGFEGKFNNLVADLISKLSQDLGEKTNVNWKEHANKLLKKERNLSLEINRQIEKQWGKPLRSLEMLLSISRQLGSDFNDHIRSNAAAENDLVFEVLTRSHGRACQVGYEILTLLKNGFADGAHARWRTLHEITVVSALLHNMVKN